MATQTQSQKEALLRNLNTLLERRKISSSEQNGERILSARFSTNTDRQPLALCNSQNGAFQIYMQLASGEERAVFIKKISRVLAHKEKEITSRCLEHNVKTFVPFVDLASSGYWITISNPNLVPMIGHKVDTITQAEIHLEAGVSLLTSLHRAGVLYVRPSFIKNMARDIISGDYFIYDFELADFVEMTASLHLSEIYSFIYEGFPKFLRESKSSIEIGGEIKKLQDELFEKYSLV